jgi:hypothetical protein
MLTVIPFSGFYETLHAAELDRAEEQFFEDSNGHPLPGVTALSQRFYLACDYQKVHAQYARAYCESFAENFELKGLEFESLDSPKEYNFTTDRIFANIPRATVRAVYKNINIPALRIFVRDNFTSRDGFASYYSGDLDTWGSVDTWDHNQLGALFSVFVDEQSDTGDLDGYAQIDLMENCSGNGYFDNWLCEAAGPEGLRVLKVADYLRARADRAWHA